MTMTMTILLAALALYLAWGCAALSMQPHWRSLAGTGRPAPVRRLRAIAVALAAAGLALCLLRDGGGLGALLWACLLCVSAWMVVLTLSWFKRS